MKTKLILYLLLAVSLAAPGAWAADDKKTDTAEKKTETSTPYQKFLKTVTDSTKGEFVSFYKAKGNKIFMEFPRELLGRKLLAGSTIKSVSSPIRVDVGYKYEDPMLIRIELEDSIAVLTQPNAGASVTNGDPRLEAAARTNFMPVLYKRIPVKAFVPDSSRFIFEITEMLKDIVNKGVINPSKDKTAYSVGAMKSFSDNASIDVTQNAEIKRSLGLFSLVYGEVTVTSTASFLLLPEEKMRPRVRDSRIGIFATYNKQGNTAMYELSPDADGIKTYVLSNRWKVEPVDMAAWKRGEKVAVKKPIVWYVDNTFPASWVPSIKKGVLAWNAAFEKIGLKDVMEVRDFPTPEEDPAFDPDNLKYSCIRFVTTPTANAMGPSWVDPTTGEILNASVIVYNDILKLINNCYRAGYILEENFSFSTDDQQMQFVSDGSAFMITNFAQNDEKVFTALVKQTNPDAWFEQMPLMDNYNRTISVTGWAGCFITKNCSDPEAAIKLIGWLKDGKNKYASQMGVEGVDWWLDENGVIVLGERYLEAQDAGAIDRTYTYVSFLLAASDYLSESSINYAGGTEQARQLYKDVRDRANWSNVLGMCDPAGTSDEGIIKSKLTDLMSEYFPIVCMSATDEEFEANFSKMLEEADAIGIKTLNTYLTKTYAELSEQFGTK